MKEAIYIVQCRKSPGDRTRSHEIALGFFDHHLASIMASPAGAGAGAGGAHFHLPHLQLPHLLQLPFGKHSSRRTTTTRARAGGGFAPPKLTTDFSGRWHKDAARSSPMTDALRVMAIGGVVRQAIKLVRGCEIKQTPDMFEMAVTSALPWFKVTERYPLDGAEIKLRRRDLRGGELCRCLLGRSAGAGEGVSRRGGREAVRRGGRRRGASPALNAQPSTQQSNKQTNNEFE